MNSKRAVGWMVFFGVAAALAWSPEWLVKQDDQDLQATAVAVAAKAKARGTLPAAVASQTPDGVKGLSPAGDLFAARSWTPAPVVVSVDEQAVNQASAQQASGAPPLPFLFIGKLDDRSDLQVFLQNGEKIYVVRKGDVIDKTWRIEGISDKEMQLVYLPLHLSQTLSVGSTQ